MEVSNLGWAHLGRALISAGVGWSCLGCACISDGSADSWIPSDGWLVEDAVSCVSGVDGQSARAVMGSHPPSDQLGRI